MVSLILIRAPKVNVSDDRSRVVELCLEEGARVGKEQVVAILETSKTAVELESPKEGHVFYQTRLLVPGNSHKTVEGELKPLAAAGRLRVAESDGKELDVVIDGAVVGQTPWEGMLAPGAHMVLLQGSENLGTAPSVATVTANRTTLLTLRAEVLGTSRGLHLLGSVIGTTGECVQELISLKQVVAEQNHHVPGSSVVVA